MNEQLFNYIETMFRKQIDISKDLQKDIAELGTAIITMANCIAMLSMVIDNANIELSKTDRGTLEVCQKAADATLMVLRKYN